MESATPARDSSVRAGLALAEEVRAGLLASPKRLSPWLFYDEVGSDLFEDITRLPEYYLTRTELAILRAHAGRMIEAAGAPVSVVELGAGSALKTAILLEALLERRARATYLPVDVSPRALKTAIENLRSRFPRLALRPVHVRYPEELAFLRQAPAPRLVLFLGSNIGNYEPDEAVSLLRQVRARLAPGDALLLGTDLRKDPSLLLPAYDDAAGVTAKFNKNLLARINRELGGHFDLGRFRHVVRWNDRVSRIELYLESAGDQVVNIDALGLGVGFSLGETIFTEASYKYTALRVERLLTAAGFALETTWCDPSGWFAVHLARV